MIKKMMSYDHDDQDTDAEIDKLLETFSMSGLIKGIQNGGGDYIENDIRINENIRDAIDEVKMI